jgi:hypothetical protein
MGPLPKYVTLILIAVAALAFSLGAGIYIFSVCKGQLSPGPISASMEEGVELAGYVSHAEFEQDCGHCHAPIHCVTDTRCQDCHIDIARERASADGLHGKLPGTDQCQTCHQEHMGRDASITTFAFANVDHNKLAGYSLVSHQQDYAGNPMNCESCHQQGSFVQETMDCLSCHIAAEHDLMAKHLEDYGDNCVECHDGADRMMAFDHNTYYVLDGQHSEVACADCHSEHVYDGTATDCASCHAEPEMHVNLFGTSCDRCHTAVAWAPAQLTQHTFLLNHGEEAEQPVACETCHMDSYTAYPCYSCHDQQEMQVYHTEIEIESIENCIECHPTGQPKEAEKLLTNQNPVSPQPNVLGAGN